MMDKKYTLVLPVVASLFGCASPVPVADNFPISYQKVARTAHHWDVVAEDVVAQTKAAIEANPVLQKRGIFVPPAEKSTAFNVAFRDFLITNMVNDGLPVSVCKSSESSGSGFAMEGSDVMVRYDAKIIGHGAYTPQYIPGTLTALAAGVKVVHNINHHLSHASTTAATIGLAALADVGIGHLAEATRTELIITTTITENNRYVMRKSDIYYVPDGDAKLFTQRVRQYSTCPQDNGPVAQAAPASNDADVEASRTAMVEREMKRWNPNWQPAPAAFSY